MSKIKLINNIKYSVEGSEIRPDYYTLLPKLLLSSSQKIDSSSGFGDRT